MKNKINDGMVLNHTVTEAEVSITSGAVVVLGTIIGVAVSSGTFANGDQVAVNLHGAYELAKDTSTEITQGDKLFWNVVGKKLTKDPADLPIGKAWDDAAEAATTAIVVFDQGAGASGATADEVVFAAGTNLTGVDGTGNNAAPLIGTETRLDSLDTAVAAIIANLQAAGLMASS